MDERFWAWFHEIYDALPRQGPGDRESTERALRALPPLTAAQRILDVGCGSGAQTLDLARATEARIVAVDVRAPLVERLARRAAELGLAGRITAQVGDMNDLRFPDASFDAIWSEGAIFVIGFAEGLARWRRLLVPHGHLVVSEPCWLRDAPAAELVEFVTGGAPAEDLHLAARRAAVAAAGYRLLDEFVLPSAGWWQNYYVPLAEELQRFGARHAGDPAALAVVARSAHEIDLYRRHPGAYGYVFFVMRREESGDRSGR